ncbi:MAG: hypothetical protein IJ762_02565 [Bacteroidaceae bacterium]|nr:hypothetical protein [Bacteroidaceae bacterium]
MKSINVSNINSGGDIVIGENNVVRSQNNHTIKNEYDNRTVQINWDMFEKEQNSINLKISELQNELIQIQDALKRGDKTKIEKLLNCTGKLIRDFLVSVSAGVFTKII